MRIFYISKTVNPFLDFVFDLSSDEFGNLKEVVNLRIDSNCYVVTAYEDAAVKYGRKPICPKCGGDEYHEDGYTDSKHKRYECKKCNCRYTILSNSIFNSAKMPFHKLLRYISLMSYNVPLELMCEVFGYKQ